MRDIMFGYSHLVMSFLLLNASDSDGGAENAGVENAGVEKAGVDSKDGKCRSEKSRSESQGWKMQKKLYGTPNRDYIEKISSY